MTECRWAKVIHSSDGHPVLFYLEHDTEHEDHQMIRCFTRMDGWDATVVLSGISYDKAQEAFDNVDQKFADKIVKTATLEGVG